MNIWEIKLSLLECLQPPAAHAMYTSVSNEFQSSTLYLQEGYISIAFYVWVLHIRVEMIGFNPVSCINGGHIAQLNEKC